MSKIIRLLDFIDGLISDHFVLLLAKVSLVGSIIYVCVLLLIGFIGVILFLLKKE